MSIEEKHRVLLHFDSLLRSKIKGSGTDIASRLGVSPATFFRILDYARRELNAPIVFDQDLQRYKYQYNGMLFFGFIPEEVVSVEKVKNIRPRS
jgi:hypothetical protein